MPNIRLQGTRRKRRALNRALGVIDRDSCRTRAIMNRDPTVVLAILLAMRSLLRQPS